MPSPDPPVALEELLAHREWVRALARALARDEHEAADVEQATWVAALRSPPATRTSLRGWLATTARRAFARIRRSERRRAAHEAAAPPRDDVADASELAARADAHRSVVAALVALDEPYRRTLLLRYFEGLPVAEVAARTGVPLETCRARLRRGMERMRARLEGEAGGRRALGAVLALVAGERGPGGGAAAAGGAAMATGKAVAAAAVVCAAIAAGVWWTARRAPTESSDVASLAAAGVGTVAAEEETTRTERGARARAPAADARAVPAPVADADPEAPARRTAAERLAETSMGGRWEKTRLLRILGEVSVAADVDVFVPADLPQLAPEEESTIASLQFEDLPAGQLLTIACTVTGFTASVEDERVLVHPVGARPAAGAALRKVDRVERSPPLERSVIVRVLTAEGGVAAGARVSNVSRRLLATADAAGSATVRCAEPYPRVVAHLAGHVDSLPAPTDAAARHGDVVELRLRGPAGRLTGSVVAGDAPVAGARVSIETRVHGSAGEATAHRVETDAAGRFDDPSATPGRADVRVYAPGFAHALAAADVVAGSETRLRIEMTAAVVVEGRVVRSDGRPVPGARVEVLLPAPWSYQRTADADADGAFVLDQLGSGRLRLVAFAGRDRVEEWVHLAPGRRFEWTAVVDGGRRVAGRVLDANGGPLAGWQVRPARDPERPTSLAFAHCDADGAFDLRCATRDVDAVTVHAPGMHVPSKRVALDALAAAGNVIVVGVREMPNATFRATAVSEDGSPLPSVRLSLHAPGADTSIGWKLDGPEIRSPKLPPGRYRIRIGAPGADDVDLGERDLAADAEVDLGTVTLPAPR